MVCVAYFFMLDTQDIQVLREMFAENNVILEDRIMGRVETLLQKELRSVRNDIIEVINDGVLPQIDRLNIRVTRLERMQRQGSY